MLTMKLMVMVLVTQRTGAEEELDAGVARRGATTFGVVAYARVGAERGWLRGRATRRDIVVTIDSPISERPKHDPDCLTRTTRRSTMACTKAWGMYVQAAGALPIMTPDGKAIRNMTRIALLGLQDVV